jgi:hypothetical protein
MGISLDAMEQGTYDVRNQFFIAPLQGLDAGVPKASPCGGRLDISPLRGVSQEEDSDVLRFVTYIFPVPMKWDRVVFSGAACIMAPV